MHRRLTGLVAFSSVALSTVVPAAAAPCGRAAAAKARTWFVATPPPREYGAVRDMMGISGNGIYSVAVDPANPAVVFVSDGASVQRSNDGGCTWTVVYELPDVPGIVPHRHLGEITSIDVARAGGHTRTLLAVRDDTSDLHATRTVVVRSDDGYRGWTPVFDSLTAGVPAVRAWAPEVHSAGPIAYAAMASGNGAVTYARSADGGRTWTVRTPLAERTETTGILGFAVNPWNTDELFAWNHALWRSTDGGVSWTDVDVWPTYEEKPFWYTADVVWPRRGGPARILVIGEGYDPKDLMFRPPLGSWSGDGGRTFRMFVPPLSVQLNTALVAHLPNGDAVVLAGNRRAWRIPHRGRPPLGSEWRALDRPPLRGCFLSLQPCNAAATTVLPGVVAMPTGSKLLLLQVAR